MVKRTLLFLSIVVIFTTTTTGLSSGDDDDDSSDFCYTGEDCGPQSSKWGGSCQSGEHQSPIDFTLPLVRATATPRKVALNFDIPGYSSPSGFWIRNNGHTIQVSLEEGLTSKGRMSGYGMDGDYIFAQIHFHWGDGVEDPGSEHTVGGKHYPVEIHFVHYDEKYGSFEEAANSGDPKGLAVLGLFLSYGTESDVNPAFDTIASVLPLHFQPIVEHITSAPLDLGSLLPSEGAPFFRYMGSLTTPNCTEAVEWSVLLDPIPVKPSEIAKFHEVLSHAGDMPMGLNYRPVQPIGDRIVEFLARDGGKPNTSGGRSWTTTTPTILLAASSFLLGLIFRLH